jgi:hypothetical protein
MTGHIPGPGSVNLTHEELGSSVLNSEMIASQLLYLSVAPTSLADTPEMGDEVGRSVHRSDRARDRGAVSWLLARRHLRAPETGADSLAVSSAMTRRRSVRARVTGAMRPRSAGARPLRVVAPDTAGLLCS